MDMSSVSANLGAISTTQLDLDIMRLSLQDERQLLQPVKTWIEKWFPRRETAPRSLLLVIERADGEGEWAAPPSLSRYLTWVANAGNYSYFVQDCTKLPNLLSANRIEQMLHDFQRHPSLGMICIRETLDRLLPVQENESRQEFTIPFSLLNIKSAQA